jgi:hypothetical protein
MGKKKGGKRLGKKQVTELLQNLFQHHPNETFSFKQIFKVLKFDGTDEPWFDYVCSCRMDGTEWQQYDIIMGRVANDDVYLTINRFLDGEMTKAAALAELRYAKPNDQIAINGQVALDWLLVFKRSYEPEVRNAESSI